MSERFSNQQPIIVCPLQFECDTLRRAGLSAICPILCCGPGSAGVERWAATVGSIKQPVILAGVAGALTNTVAVRSATIITEVVEDNSPHRWRPNYSFNTTVMNSSSCVITSAKSSLITKEEKRALRTRTAAEVVDQESVAFARIAEAVGWTWAIVRGISDGVDSALPPEADQWVDDRGQSRIGRIALSILLRPVLVGKIARLGADSKAAMKAVARLIDQ